MYGYRQIDRNHYNLSLDSTTCTQQKLRTPVSTYLQIYTAYWSVCCRYPETRSMILITPTSLTHTAQRNITLIEPGSSNRQQQATLVMLTCYCNIGSFIFRFLKTSCHTDLRTGNTESSLFYRGSKNTSQSQTILKNLHSHILPPTK